MSDAHQEIYIRFTTEHVDRLVEELPERCQLVFKYSRLEGKANREIAEIMNIAEKTVEAHLAKALKSLRLSLKHLGIFSLLILLLDRLF